jgi:hypothetical protein
MKMIRRTAATLLVLVGSLLPASIGLADDPGPSSPGNPPEAAFENRTLDLSSAWGPAKACIELSGRVECYRTESDLDAAYPEFAAGDGQMALLATCSSSLRLYRSTGFTGGTLVLTTRGVVHNLSTYGFDNDTSSYAVGACASTFWAGASGSGSVYPGNTGAFANASQMLSGWNNVVSSVYIS